MDTSVSTLTQTLFYQTYSGKPESVLHRVGEIPSTPHRLLVEGAAIAITQPERALDLLSQAERGLEGDLRDRATIRKACCYWAKGEISEARAVLESISPLSPAVIFEWAVAKSAIEHAKPDYALGCLKIATPHLDAIDNPLLKGKYFNQRAGLLHLTGDDDGAIIAYTEARHWFQEAADPILANSASNNIGNLLRHLGQFAAAHEEVNKAKTEFTRLGETVYLAQAYDTESRLFYAERKYAEAVNAARSSITLLVSREQKELRARSLITEAMAHVAMQEYSAAMSNLDEAEKIAHYLENENLLFDVAWELRELAKKIRHAAEYSLIVVALKEGSYRSAAKKMKIFHHAFIKLVKKHGLDRTPKSPTRRILNARKK